MSAIAGIRYKDGRPVESVQLQQMVGALSHRGKDGADTHHAGAVGLGHCAHWTTPEASQEKMPLVSKRGTLILTADARIDNRQSLMQLLSLTDTRSENALTDSELILAAYQKWDVACVEKLIGDFAFAIWDARLERLFCARDVMGVRPFYYYDSTCVFAFASEIKALLVLPEVPRRLNEVRVAYHITRRLEDRCGTFYRDIWRLPAAHYMVVDRNGLYTRRYWEIDFSDELRLASHEAYAEALRAKFTDAVQRRLRCSQFPVASFLSGGLDSSSIVCSAHNLLNQQGETQEARLHTFSAIFPSLPEEDLRVIDERDYINVVVKQTASAPHFVSADALSPLAELDQMLWHLDEAFFGPNLYMHWALYRAVHEQGIHVLLDGIDGDSAVSHGYEYLTALAGTGRWWRLFREAQALARNLKTPHVTTKRIVWKCGFRPLLPHQISGAWRRLRGRPSQPIWGIHTAIASAFATRIELAERMRALLTDMKPTRNARQAHWRHVTSAPIQYAIELADKASRAFAIEPRYPFCDRELLAFCLSLPADQKLRQGWDRAVMRRAMKDVIPHAVQKRTTKANLSPNFKRRLLRCERDALERTVFEPSEAIVAYYDVTALKAAYERYAAYPAQMEQDAFTLFGAVVLDHWLRQRRLAP